MPNAGLLIGSLLGWLLGGMVPLLGAILWASFSCIQAVTFWSLATRVKQEDLRNERGEAAKAGPHAFALSVGAVTSAVLPNVYLSAVTLLGAGVASILFTVGRIGTSVVGIGVNSILLVLYSWKKSDFRVAGGVRALAIAAATFATAALLIPNLNQSLSYAGTVLMWFILLVASAVALREMNARGRVGLVVFKVSLDLGVSLGLAALLLISPSVTGFFGAYSASQSVTLVAAGCMFKSPTITAAGVYCLVVSTMMVVFGW
ncbi:hypothetical protein [Microbacterium lacus]|uniref:hypothetical protein n=1 Tax=Microbacterium lacus TaxID=415217 RepID=UPI0012FDB5B4|nr:hypothetical protein [Microbacterium lacus]